MKLKLTEIPGAKEALPEKKVYTGYNSRTECDIHNEVVATLSAIEVEVDVEKLSRLLYETGDDKTVDYGEIPVWAKVMYVEQANRLAAAISELLSMRRGE